MIYLFDHFVVKNVGFSSIVFLYKALTEKSCKYFAGFNLKINNYILSIGRFLHYGRNDV
jgi:hypothetical protein